MIEELKVIAEIFNGITNGAIIGVCAYLAVDLLKVITVAGFIFLSIKAVVTGVFKPSDKQEFIDANKD